MMVLACLFKILKAGLPFKVIFKLYWYFYFSKGSEYFLHLGCVPFPEHILYTNIQRHIWVCLLKAGDQLIKWGRIKVVGFFLREDSFTASTWCVSFSDQGHGVLEMPSGTGKTISLLSLIVAYQKVSLAAFVFLLFLVTWTLFNISVPPARSGLTFGSDQADILLQNCSRNWEGESMWKHNNTSPTV